jgi:hypothetical protein
MGGRCIAAITVPFLGMCSRSAKPASRGSGTGAYVVPHPASAALDYSSLPRYKGCSCYFAEEAYLAGDCCRGALWEVNKPARV